MQSYLGVFYEILRYLMTKTALTIFAAFAGAKNVHLIPAADTYVQVCYFCTFGMILAALLSEKMIVIYDSKSTYELRQFKTTC